MENLLELKSPIFMLPDENIINELYPRSLVD